MTQSWGQGREVDLRGLRRSSCSEYVQIPLHQILEAFIKIVIKLRKMKVEERLFGKRKEQRGIRVRKETRGNERRVNMVKVHCRHVWNCCSETHCFVY